MNTELYHYGVLGMKWGVRKDNSKEARQRRRKRLSTTAKVISPGAYAIYKGGKKIKNKHKNYKQKQRAKKKELDKNLERISSMSNKDIDERITRLEKEIKLRDLEYKRSADSRTSRAIESVLADAGEIAVKDVVAGSMTYAGTKVSSAVLGGGVTDYIPKKGKKK